MLGRRLVCFAVFWLLCNYTREDVSEYRGLDSEQEVVVLW